MSTDEGSKMHPQMERLLQEADAAYQTFLKKMSELEQERTHIYAEAMKKIDARRISDMKHSF